MEIFEEGDIYVNLDSGDIVESDEPEYEKTNPQLKNIARDLSEERLKTLATKFLEEYREDEESRRDWLEQLKMWLQVYNQQDFGGTREPFPGASKDHVPILTEAVNQFANRATQRLFNQSEFARGRPYGNITRADVQKAKRVEKYINYLTQIKDKNYKQRLKKLLKALPLYGSMFRKRFYNPVTKTVEVVNIEPENLIIPMGSQPCHISEVDRKTHRYWISESKAKRYYKDGYYISMPKMPEQVNENADPLTQEKQENNKTTQAETKNLARKIEILEQHRFCDLEGDGTEKPYIVWICPNSEKILRVAARYKIDKKQKTYGEVWDSETFTNRGSMVDNSNFGAPVNYDPIEYFTHFAYSENANGFYAEGMGTLLGGTNRSVNRILRQCIDAATLANIPSGFISKQLGIQKGEIKLKLGELTPIDASTDDIRKGIFLHDFKGPNPALLQLMEAMISRSDRLGMLTEAVTGTTEKVIQPTTFLNLIEQSLQGFTAAMINVADALTEELNGIYGILGEYMDEKEYFAVLDGDEMINNEISPDDFEVNLDLIVVADPRLATDQQRQDRTKQVFELMMSNPLMQQDPNMITELYRYTLENMDVPREDIDRLLPKAPPMQQPQAPQPQSQPQGLGLPAMEELFGQQAGAGPTTASTNPNDPTMVGNM